MFGFPAAHSDLVGDSSSHPAVPCQLDRTTEKGAKEFCGNQLLKRDKSSYVPPAASDVRSETDYAQCLLNINAGDLNGSLICCGMKFQKDCFFIGGDTVRTNTNVGAGETSALYRTARFGNFSYKLATIKPGNYVVVLHLAEIMFETLPSGRRTFDVFIQEEKVKKHLRTQTSHFFSCS